MEEILAFVTSAVYLGFCFSMILILLFRKKIGELNFKVLVVSNSYLVLARAIILCASLLLDLFSDWFDAFSYNKYALANRASGPYSLLFWLSIGASYALPLLFLIKRYRANMLCIWLILGIWALAYIAFLAYLSSEENLWSFKYEISFSQIIGKLVCHSILLGLTYFVCNKRYKEEFTILDRNLY